MKSDEELIELCRVDIDRGMSEIISRYSRELYWYIRRVITDHSDTDDILQEVFIKVWKNIYKFKGNSTLKTWIWSIATNEIRYFIRKRKLLSIFISKENQDNLDDIISDEMTEFGDIEKKLVKALNSLPVRQKLVFNMRYYEDMSYEEMSKILNVSVGGLKSSYHIAVKKIEKYLQDN